VAIFVAVVVSDPFAESVDTTKTINRHQQRCSVVWASVFGQCHDTGGFFDLRLTYIWQVTTFWVNCPLWDSQLGKLSLPSLRGRSMRSTPCIFMHFGVEAT